MSPRMILVIFFLTGCSSSELFAHFTKPRSFGKYVGNTNPNPDSEIIRYYKARPEHYETYKPQHKRIAHQRNEVDSYNSRLYRSYGRGKAEIPYLGATVSVLNAVTYPKVQKEGATSESIDSREESAQQVFRARRKCRSCPRNRKVMASKGNTHVLLPEPCTHLKWYSVSGPQPGALLKGGHYTLIGRVGTRGKLCQYKYEVVVRRCGGLNETSAYVNCTAEDAWGSKCTFTCDSNQDLKGSEVLECGDDLKWSHETPVCKRKIGCSYPQTPDNKKISCQVPEDREELEDLLPGGTQCRYKSKGGRTTLTCLDGYWVRTKTRERKNKMGRVKKQMKLKRKSQ